MTCREEATGVEILFWRFRGRPSSNQTCVDFYVENTQPRSAPGRINRFDCLDILVSAEAPAAETV